MSDDARINIDPGIGRGATLVSVAGRVGIEEANELQAHFDEIIRAGRPWIILDLRDVDFICSAGMGTLLSGVGEARRAGGEVIFADISRKARTVFEFLDIWDYITSAQDVETALEMVGEGKRLVSRTGAEPEPARVSTEELQKQIHEGVRLSKEGKLKDALLFFNGVLKNDKDNVPALTWKANALERLGQFGEARRLYVRVVELGRGDPKLLAYARERSDKLGARLGAPPESGRDLASLADILKPYVGPATGKLAFFAGERSFPLADTPFLESYRTWDEGWPFVGEAPAEISNRGGGYYLWIGGRGFVVDPGRSFIARFAAAGRRLIDIDAVVITSDRWERRSDFEALLELLSNGNGRDKAARKRVDVFIHGRLYNREYSWLSAVTEAIGSVSALEAGRSYTIGSCTLEIKIVSKSEGREGDYIGIAFADGIYGAALLPPLGGVDVEAAARNFRAARGRILIAETGAFVGGDDGRTPYVPTAYPTNIARLLIEIKPALALLTGFGNVSAPIEIAGALTQATNVRCLPLDTGARFGLADGNLQLGGKYVTPAEIVVTQLNNGRIEYTAPR